MKRTALQLRMLRYARSLLAVVIDHAKVELLCISSGPLPIEGSPRAINVPPRTLFFLPFSSSPPTLFHPSSFLYFGLFLWANAGILVQRIKVTNLLTSLTKITLLCPFSRFPWGRFVVSIKGCWRRAAFPLFSFPLFFSSILLFIGMIRVGRTRGAICFFRRRNVFGYERGRSWMFNVADFHVRNCHNWSTHWARRARSRDL